jgi:outer membrane protein OmpA-like peptidoglycan-associated protein
MNRKQIMLALCAGLLSVTGCAHDKARERTTVSAVTNEEVTGDEDEAGKTRMSYTAVGDEEALKSANADAPESASTDSASATAEANQLAQGTTAQGSPTCTEAVYFESNSARLDGNAEAHLSRVAECLRRREVDHALIVGRTDASGTEAHNRELGMERARAVADYLRKLGVPEKDIRVRSKGEVASAESEELWPAERRANVVPQ